MTIMFKIFGLIIAATMILTSCASAPSVPQIPTLEDTLIDPRVVKFPLQTTAHGRWVVTVNVNEDSTADMVLDTGATYSAFFENSIEPLGLQINTDKLTRIHGLVTNADAANTKVKEFQIGNDVFYDKSFAVLPVNINDPEDQNPSDGIIGMDILQAYRIFIDSSESEIYFIPNEISEFSLPPNLRAIPLYANPYNDAAPSLHFLSLTIKLKETPALLDTGTDINIINWHAANFVEAKALRARLKWKWEVSGAVGTFKPSARAKMSKVSAGRHEWLELNMIVKDTDSLSILGVDEQPFIVAGIDFLDNRDVYLDFQNDKLWLNHLQGDNSDPSNILSVCVSC